MTKVPHGPRRLAVSYERPAIEQRTTITATALGSD
jgi:hypothetical protein